MRRLAARGLAVLVLATGGLPDLAHGAPLGPDAPGATEARPLDPPARPDRKVTGTPRSLDEALEGLDDTGSPAPPPREPPPPRGPPLEAGERRPVPDYDGRRDPPPDAADALLWVPRVAFFPVYVVFEYGLRIPIVWTVTRLEETKIVDRALSYLRWDDDRAAIYPLIYTDFGVRPNLGLRMRWRQFAPRTDINVNAFAGPNDLWAAFGGVDSRLFRNDTGKLSWFGSYVRRPDNVFYGISDPNARCNREQRGCRYRSALADARVRLVAYEQELTRVYGQLAYRHARFSRDGDTPNLTASEAADLNAFENGYQLVKPEVRAELDSRDPSVDFGNGTGLRTAFWGSFNVDPDAPRRRWVRAGAEASAFYDFGFEQILAARIYGETIGNLSDQLDRGIREPVPFEELIQLGGADYMRGFLPRRLMGERAWVATAQYSYPIAWALDAALFTSIGNTYRRFSDFRWKRNYLNYGFEMRLNGSRQSAFALIVAWGSNQLGDRAPGEDFEPFRSFRLTLGINQGF